jgi:hypothetical protein
MQKTRSELSRRWGVTRQAVSALFLRPGAPSFDADGRIDVEVADAWRDAVREARREAARGREELDRLRCRLLAHEIAMQRGRLVSIEDVERIARADAAIIRASLLAMPDALAPRLTGLTDTEAARGIIDDWARGTLQMWHDSLTE